MRVVNLQLAEQAQAAIEDKVAPMSIQEVLSDKQPIIEELTRRLKTVAEGTGGDKGLGIRIVTVQVKEAVVSSTTVWDNLQKPFRAEQDARARLSEIEGQARVHQATLEDRKTRDTAQLETEAELDRLRKMKEAEAFDRQAAEATRRHTREQEAQRQRTGETVETDRLRKEAEETQKEREAALAHQLARHQVELAVERHRFEQEELKARLAHELADKARHWELNAREQQESDRVAAAAQEASLARGQADSEARNEQTARELGFEAQRQKIANDVSPALVQLKAVESVPRIAESLPKPETLHAVAVGGQGPASLEGVLAAVLGVLKAYGIAMPTAALPPAPREASSACPDAPQGAGPA